MLYVTPDRRFAPSAPLRPALPPVRPVPAVVSGARSGLMWSSAQLASRQHVRMIQVLSTLQAQRAAALTCGDLPAYLRLNERVRRVSHYLRPRRRRSVSTAQGLLSWHKLGRRVRRWWSQVRPRLLNSPSF